MAQAVGALLVSFCFALTACNSDNVTVMPAANGSSSGGTSSGGTSSGGTSSGGTSSGGTSSGGGSTSSVICTSSDSSTGGAPGSGTASCVCVAGSTETSGMSCTAVGDGGLAGSAGCAGAGSSATVTLNTDGGTITIHCGGFTGTVTLPASGGTSGSTVAVNASTSVPTGTPDLPDSGSGSSLTGGAADAGGAVTRSATPSGPTNTVLFFISVSANSTLQLTRVPPMSVTAPPGITFHAGTTSVAWYDPVLDTYTDFGNVSISGQTLTFSGFPMNFTQRAQQVYGLVVYDKNTSGGVSGNVTVSGIPATDDTLLLAVGQSGVGASSGRLAAVPLYRATQLGNDHCVTAGGVLSCPLTGVVAAAGSPAYFDGGAFAAASGPEAMNACFASSLGNPVAGFALTLQALGGAGCPLSAEGP